MYARFSSATGTVGDRQGAVTLVNFFFLNIYDSTDWCDPAGGGMPPRPFWRLQVSLSKPRAIPITADTYALSSSTFGAADGWYADFTESSVSSMLYGTSGQLELTRLTSDVAEGTVDLTLADGTRMEGPFQARACP